MTIWQHCIQFGIDMRFAFSKLFREIWRVLFDADARILRRNRRLGQRYVALYTRQGKFVGLDPRAGVAIDIETGEFVTAASDIQAIDVFRAKYGSNRPCYVHSLRPKWV